MKSIRLITAAALGASLAAVPQVHAKARNQEQQEELNRQTVALKELGAADKEGHATSQLGTAEAWLKEADNYARKRKTRDEFRQTMDRVASMVGLIEATLERAAAGDRAAKAIEAADSVEAKLNATNESAVETEQRKAELEGKVGK